MKRILSQFAITVTVIFSLCFITAGSSLVSRRSAEISEGERFAVFAVKNQSKKLEIESGQDRVSIDFSGFDELKKYRNLVFFTPVGAAVGFARTVKEVFANNRNTDEN